MTTIKLIPKGPAIIEGDHTLIEEEHIHASTKTALCRCGKSNKFPFCDGSHNRI